ncbi:malectin domain-containing carbohydrate-binding protein [Paraburkholderia megapolitana]|uniref:malectin domain-containing carbohydrate-binding protein n=1 Tax=Paraburkholderia megapolitana TaxID=420953 RepID=UPI0038BAA88C
MAHALRLKGISVLVTGLVTLHGCGGDNPVSSGNVEKDAATPSLSATSSGGSAETVTPVDTSTVRFWLTDSQTMPTAQRNLRFRKQVLVDSEPNLIEINDDVQMQTMIGFGAAMTDSSASNISQLSNADQKTLIDDLFSRDKGIGISFVRIPMGSSDYTATPVDNPGTYSYDDMPSGQSDPNLDHFSITHDQGYIIPALLSAQKANPKIFFMANPWSPPGWMKVSGSMLGGGGLASNLTPTGSELKDTSYAPLAQYFVKFLQGYQKAGLRINAISPQNEPTITNTTYSNSQLSAPDEARFVTTYLQPALGLANLNPAIWINDDNDGNSTSYVPTVLQSTGVANGIAWHCYSDDSAAQSSIHNQNPLKDTVMTECSSPSGFSSVLPAHGLLSAVRNWAIGTQFWNLALNLDSSPRPGGGPKMGQGCTSCIGVATIDPTDSEAPFSFTSDYYVLAAVSKFVPPGAIRIRSSWSNAGIQDNAAFKNPDGTIVLVISNNTGSSDENVSVLWNGRSFDVPVPAGKIATLQWNSGKAASASKSVVAVGPAGDQAGISDDSGNVDSGDAKISTTTNYIDRSGVVDPLPESAYQSERYGNSGNFSYKFPNLDGQRKYTIRLHFAEFYFSTIGSRVFNVTINGATVLSNFDIVKEAGGGNIAIVKEFSVKPTSNGIIQVSFAATVNNPKVDGIEIVSN